MIETVLPAGAGALAALAWGVYEPNARLFGRAIGRGPRGSPICYLTFDDGPNPTATTAILATLAARDVPAAFFMVGRHVRRHPELARAVASAGHEIGNHTDGHVKLHVRGPRRIRAELETAHETIAALTARAPRAFRAPHGYRNPFVTLTARRLGYTV